MALGIQVHHLKTLLIEWRKDRTVHFEIGEMIHILMIILLMYMYVNVSCLTKICGKQS